MSIPPPGAFLVLAAAGALGAVLRYLLDITFTAAQHRRAPARSRIFPWGILAANTTGCLLVGAIASWASGHGVSLDPTALDGIPALLAVTMVVGVGGGLSTMSTFIIGAVSLWRDGSRGMALAYTGLTFTAGLAAGYLGTLLAGVLP